MATLILTALIVLLTLSAIAYVSGKGKSDDAQEFEKPDLAARRRQLAERKRQRARLFSRHDLDCGLGGADAADVAVPLVLTPVRRSVRDRQA